MHVRPLITALSAGCLAAAVGLTRWRSTTSAAAGSSARSASTPWARRRPRTTWWSSRTSSKDTGRNTIGDFCADALRFTVPQS